MRLRIVGSSPSLPRPGGACSCYLVRTASVNVLLDVGPGALAKLVQAVSYDEIDAVVISHMHPDHFLDIVPLRYCLRFGRRERGSKLPLWLPPAGAHRLAALARALESGEDGAFFDGVYDVREYDPGAGLRIGGVTLDFAKTVHYIDAYAIRAASDGKTLCYSGDTAPCDSVVALAADADLFLCEASLGLESEQGATRGHLSAFEAGEMAQRAGSRRLALTHYGDSYGAAALEEAARSNYRGPCIVVDDGTDLHL
jgi:ribonuclease BN (tRNA processing enzyme)